MSEAIQNMTDEEVEKLLALNEKLCEILNEVGNHDVLYWGLICNISERCTLMDNTEVNDFVKNFSKNLKKTIKSMKKLEKTGSP